MGGGGGWEEAGTSKQGEQGPKMPKHRKIKINKCYVYCGPHHLGLSREADGLSQVLGKCRLRLVLCPPSLRCSRAGLCVCDMRVACYMATRGTVHVLPHGILVSRTSAHLLHTGPTLRVGLWAGAGTLCSSSHPAGPKGCWHGGPPRCTSMSDWPVLCGISFLLLVLIC